MRNSTKISMCTGTFDLKSLISDTSDHEMLDIRDVAHALARARKFPDLFDGFYSVAQHNVLTACRVNTLICFVNGHNLPYILKADIPREHLELWKEHRLALFENKVENLALFRDAYRAYMDNAPTWIPDSSRIMLEGRLTEEIYRKWIRFGHGYDINGGFLQAANLLVGWADDEVLSWARQEFLGIPSRFKTVRDVKIDPWSQERAEKEFLDRTKQRGL